MRPWGWDAWAEISDLTRGDRSSFAFLSYVDTLIKGHVKDSKMVLCKLEYAIISYQTLLISVLNFPACIIVREYISGVSHQVWSISFLCVCEGSMRKCISHRAEFVVPTHESIKDTYHSGGSLCALLCLLHYINIKTFDPDSRSNYKAVLLVFISQMRKLRQTLLSHFTMMVTPHMKPGLIHMSQSQLKNLFSPWLGNKE